MDEQDKQLADAIRSGTYFTQARAWFDAVYIGPISERTFFCIIAILAGLVGIFSVSSVFRLMPLTNRDPVLVYASDRADDVYMSLLPLTERREPVNPAIAKFYVTQYVLSREGYFAQTFLANARFVRVQSDVAAYNAYAVAYDPSNAASPFAALGEYGQRFINIQSARVDVDSEGKGKAEVKFVSETKGVDAPSTTNWTAKIDFNYTDLTSQAVDNKETGKKDLNVTDPHFQVVNYVLQQTQ
jgi:type IV secretion system protein VirB8